MSYYKKTSGVYLITCSLNKKLYVGQSINIRKRWDAHKHCLRRGIHGNRFLQEDWKLYGESAFTFSIIENLPFDLTAEEFKELETKWVLYFNSHKTEFGYNATLPGSIPLREQDENKTILGHTGRECLLIAINCTTGERMEFTNPTKAFEFTGVPTKKINDCCRYWEGKTPAARSRKGWMFVHKEDYKEDISYQTIYRPKKQRPKSLLPRDYKKAPEDIIPYEERNIKRVPIIAVNIETKKEILIPTMSHATKYGFNLTKVLKCINHEFGRYKHKDHYFKRVLLQEAS